MSRSVYQLPTPEAVARLVSTHGFDTAVSRWGHITDSRALASLARTGRAQAGQRPLAERPRRTPSDIELAALETACVIGSLSAGVRVAGINESSLCGVFTGRGLDWPRQSSAARAVTSTDVALSHRGDLAAAARIQARRAHEQAVYAVLRAALALVPEQPPTGRPVLPEPSPALRDALKGLDRTAVEQVFPNLF
ncbi:MULTISPECIES: hypothetical protein [unclassified Methylobacterium]|uniref:hypothetical protein n=1 Tax=unclassified Methylobacterium TaxID=2615210 RepID=UPI000CADA503|nr:MULTISPECIES: hypothetical protein [unclassified Methylobacterium]PIU05069.1 MAG: hypothetical protein COT56_16475 [Methylobacterium sp. CG09_land_8_20_14_0_10_71_15]PIU11859.1 MAG: hypothetical protein COT28_17830 [Methylobacterium sp. CG08_land_8_20_14_0_20_71_15]GBU19026.1 hypothetical protein AwMethylo_32410 [Methylobacterium sp.]